MALFVGGPGTQEQARQSNKNKNKSSGGSKGVRPGQTTSGGGGSRGYTPPYNPPSTSSGSVPSVGKAAPKPPSIGSFLSGDDIYQQAVRGSRRTLKDFLSELTRRRGEAGTFHAQTQEQMELDRERQLQRLRDEFSSRGTLQSGLYGQEQGRFQEDFARQVEQTQQQYKQLLADILGQETSFRREQELALEAARQEALARRASRYGV